MVFDMSRPNKNLTKFEELLARLCNNDEMQKALLIALEERRAACLEEAHRQGLNAVFDPAQRDAAVAAVGVMNEYDALVSFVQKQ